METDSAVEIRTQLGFPQLLENSLEDSAFSQFPQARRRAKYQPISVAAIHLKTRGLLSEEWGAPHGGYRNGYGKERRLTLSCGTIKLRRPRVRDLEERFESRVLPLFAKRTQEVRDLIPELYLHGLAEGDFDLALRGLLGEEAPLSPSTVARLKEKWQGEMEAWQSRRLDDLEVVYLWADGVYIKAGLEKEKAVILVVIAALSDGTKVVVSVSSGYRESTQSWSEVLRD